MKRIKDFRGIFRVIEEIGLANLIGGRNGILRKKSVGSTNPTLVKKAIKTEEKWLRTAYNSLGIL